MPGVKLTKFSLVFHETRPVVCGRQLGGQHGETGCQRERSLVGAPDLELREIGASDAGVAADVDDVDPVHVFPEVIDGSGDDPARDQRLPQADLVGNEEAGRTVRIQKQAAESVVDSSATTCSSCWVDALQAWQAGNSKPSGKLLLSKQERDGR